MDSRDTNILSILKIQYGLLLSQMDTLLERSQHDAEGRRLIRNATQTSVANYELALTQVTQAHPHALAQLSTVIQQAQHSIEAALENQHDIREATQMLSQAVNAVAHALEHLPHRPH